MGKQWHQLDHVQIIYTLPQTAMPAPHQLMIYGTDDLHGVQPPHVLDLIGTQIS